MPSMTAMNDTLRANGRRVALEAEVRNFDVGVIFAQLTNLSVRLVDCRLVVGWYLVVRSLTAGA